MVFKRNLYIPTNWPCFPRSWFLLASQWDLSECLSWKLTRTEGHKDSKEELPNFRIVHLLFGTWFNSPKSVFFKTGRTLSSVVGSPRTVTNGEEIVQSSNSKNQMPWEWLWLVISALLDQWLQPEETKIGLTTFVFFLNGNQSSYGLESNSLKKVLLWKKEQSWEWGGKVLTSHNKNFHSATLRSCMDPLIRCAFEELLKMTLFKAC